MFQKPSRYRTLPELIGTDKQGRGIRTKELRLLPDVNAVQQHQVLDSDRLDHLAYKYYHQSRKWWRICDANPDFPNPLSLLGQDASVTEIFSLDGGDPAVLPALLEDLRHRSGVEDVVLEKISDLVPRVVMEAGHPVNIISEDLRVRLTIRYNRFTIDRFALMDHIEARGFARVPPMPIGRVGKSIGIPGDGAA